MRIESLSIPMLILSLILSAVCPRSESVNGHWQYDEYWNTTFYVYETEESAVYVGGSETVAHFRTEDGNYWDAFVESPELQEGDEVTLTFENRVTQEEYARAEEYGYETREDSGRIVAID